MEENGIAAPLSTKARRCGKRTLSVIAARCHLPRKGEVLRGVTPSVKAYGFATFPKGTAFARGRQSLRLKRKACGRACSPLGELSRSD